MRPHGGDGRGMTDAEYDRALAEMLATRLRAARRRAGLTQRQVADALGISEAVYWRYENQRTMPSVTRLYELSVALDCPVDELLGQDVLAPGPPPAPPTDPLPLRRALRRLRRASAKSVRLVGLLLAELRAGEAGDDDE